MGAPGGGPTEVMAALRRAGITALAVRQWEIPKKRILTLISLPTGAMCWHPMTPMVTNPHHHRGREQKIEPNWRCRVLFDGGTTTWPRLPAFSAPPSRGFNKRYLSIGGIGIEVRHDHEGGGEQVVERRR